MKFMNGTHRCGSFKEGFSCCSNCCLIIVSDQQSKHAQHFRVAAAQLHKLTNNPAAHVKVVCSVGVICPMLSVENCPGLYKQNCPCTFIKPFDRRPNSLVWCYQIWKIIHRLNHFITVDQQLENSVCKLQQANKLFISATDVPLASSLLANKMNLCPGKDLFDLLMYVTIPVIWQYQFPLIITGCFKSLL